MSRAYEDVHMFLLMGSHTSATIPARTIANPATNIGEGFFFPGTIRSQEASGEYTEKCCDKSGEGAHDAFGIEPFGRCIDPGVAFKEA